LGVALLHVLFGSSSAERPFQPNLSFAAVFRTLFEGPEGSSAGTILVWQLRLPRVLACLLVGGILGFVGSAFQALFRNPLAEPFIVGASSGAAMGGALAIVTGCAAWAGGFGTLAFTLAGGMAALGLVLSMATVNGYVDTQRLLLAGVVVATFLSSVVAFLLLMAGEDSSHVLRWLLGSVTPMFWRLIPPLAAAFLIGGAILFGFSRSLNALATGEETAQRLGVDVRRLKPLILVVGTAMTAVAVGTVGIVGFLGLIAPHIARRCVGVDWRISLPASALVGMGLLTLADLAAQWLIPGAEIPVGVVSALIGSPVLLALLRRELGRPGPL
jgi:iron complex transport system permease protein